MATKISDLIEKLEQLKETYGDAVLLTDDGSRFDQFKDFHFADTSLVCVEQNDNYIPHNYKEKYSFVSYAYPGYEIPEEAIVGLVLHTEPSVGSDFED